MDQITEVQTYFQKLGLDPEAALLYIELAKGSHSSALQLAKTTRISRTQVYRHLENLQQHGLTSAEQLSYGTLYRALPLDNIEGLLTDREAETTDMRKNLGNLIETMQTLTGNAGPKATIQHYYGVAGLKQANWNLTKADQEYRVFEVAHLSQHLDKAFARRHRERCLERQLISYDLTNDTSVKLADLEPIDPKRAFFRHIDPKVLTINFEVYIYNDVVTLLDYSKQQPLAIEIHHPTLKAMMQQIYDSIWSTAQPITIEP